MGGAERFSAAVLGLEVPDLRVLSSVFAISEHRTPTFYPYVPARDAPAQVVVVNAENPRAVDGWSAYQRRHGAGTAGILLGGAPGPRYQLRRPLIATRLLALMERLVTETFGFTPALAISVDEGPLVAPAVPAARGPGLAALVVDDSLPVRTQMKLALQPIASQIDFAESGDEAEELIVSRRYDIVFLDVILPGKDGYQLCKLIKQDPERRSTPVIMLTSNSSPADRIKGKLAGCDTYLIKPVRNAVFQEIVREFLNTRAVA